MAASPCIICGVPTTNGTRCVDCNRGFERGQRNPLYADRVWRKTSKAMIAEHVARFGWWCPGFGVPAHPSRDLTTDHVIPGTERGGLQVFCRGCNTRKRHADTPSRRRARAS